MKWFSCVLALLMAVVLSDPEVEAGKKTKMRSFSRCQGGGCSTRVENSYSFDSNCSSAQIVSAPASVSCSSCPTSASCQTCPTVGIANYAPSGGGRTVVRSSYKFTGYSSDLNLQAWAIDEANRMADLGTNGHTKPAPAGYFVGVGCNGMTCSKPGTPVAEAHIRGKSVRVWRN